MLFEIARLFVRCFLHVFLMLPISIILLTPIVIVSIVACAFGFESYLIGNQKLDRLIKYITKPMDFIDTINRRFS